MKKDKKTIGYSLLLLIPFIIFSTFLYQEASAAVIFEENWDTGTPTGCWPCLTSPCNTTFNNWAVYAPIVNGEAGLSTIQKHSGTRSYYQYKVPSTPDACNIIRYFSEPLPSTIYLRFYLYLGSGWTTTWAGSMNLSHWIFTNSAYSGTGFRLNLVTHGYWGDCPVGQICMLPEGGPTSWWDNNANPPWQAGVDFRTLIGFWHCLEYKMEISGGGSYVTLTEWIDGVLTRGPCIGPRQNASTFDRIIISGYDNAATSSTLDWYIDDIVVADEYIGPTGAPPDTTPPAVPTGVTVR